MEFTYKFIEKIFFGIELGAPLLVFLAVLITLLGQIVGWRESWKPFDSLYWSFITATTVGYGDIRPLLVVSRVFSVLIALVGMIFTGIVVALAINAANITFSSMNEGLNPAAIIEKIQ